MSLLLFACTGGGPKAESSDLEAAPLSEPAPQTVYVPPPPAAEPLASEPAASEPQVAEVTALAAAEPGQTEAVLSAVLATAAAGTDRDFRAEAAKYIGYYKSYRLTPEQEAVKNAALSKMPAPCCADKSMATCCCPCNMAKAVWGLSAHLIVEEGYDAARLEKTVRDWLADANPNGYSGKGCYTGGCTRPFHEDGCGGMVDGYIF